MKRCFKCGVEKALKDFYRHRMMADGHLNKCKQCAKRDGRDHRRQHPDVVHFSEQLSYRRHRAERLAKAATYNAIHADVINAAKQRYVHQHREHRRANITVSNAIRDGHLKKPDTCDFCHEVTAVTAHHWDYGEPFTVSWLCAKCHRIADHARREAEARLMRKASA